MPALTAQHLRKSYGPQTILEDVSLSLARGEKVGLIGSNGTGKSTLAKILTGEEVADGGTIAIRRGLRVSYLSQEPRLDETRTAREVAEEGLTEWRRATVRHAEVSARLAEDDAGGNDHDALVAEQASLAEEIDHLGGWDRGHVASAMLQRLGVVEIDRVVAGRSGGERRRIALARLLVMRPDVAILDEPTNHLDADTAEWLEEHLAHEFPGALLLVTHDRYFLDAIAERILELDRGVVRSFDGGFQAYLEKKEELSALEDRTEQNRRNVLRREREWLARGPQARTTKQKARIQRATAMIAETPANAGRAGQVALAATTVRHGRTILELHGVSLGVGGVRTLTEPFDLRVGPGERVGVVGPNGVGKTTLLAAIIAAAGGNAKPTQVVAGELVVGKNTKIGLLDQMRGGLDDNASIFDDVKGDGATTVVLGDPARGGTTMDLRAYLELFLFDDSKQRQKIGALSGGERARVALAKLLRMPTNLLLLDEPTNDLDLATLGALEELLLTYAGSVVVVTHDRAFLDRVATSLLAFVPGAAPGGSTESNGVPAPARVEKHGGGYSDFVAHRAELAAQKKAAAVAQAEVARASAPPPRADGQPAGKAGAKKSALSWAEKGELEALPEKIEAAEQAAAALEAELADPTTYAKRGAEVAGLNERLAKARTEIEALMARWEALEAKRG
jgi:ATP-binding cassette subfamily F protein uup